MTEETLVSRIGIYNNLNDPVPSWNHPGVIMAVSASMTCLSSICVVYRLYIRLFVVRAKGWDDFFVLLYLITGLVSGIGVCLAPHFGLGQHILLLKSSDIKSYLTIFYATNASYNMSTTFIKISLLFQYLRVFQSGHMRIMCIVMMAIIGLWGAGYSLMAWVPCIPVSGYWNLEMEARCYGFGSRNANEFYKSYLSHTVVNTVLDMIVFTIPIPLYFQRDTIRRTKLGLAGVVSTGAVVNGLSIWRLATIVEHRATTSPTFDPTWYGPISIMLGTLEAMTASICASFPIFWPSLKVRLDEIFVTREVTITLNRRSNRFSVDAGDTIELQRTASEDRDNKWKRCPSIAGSESSQSRLAELAPVEKRAQHYQDDFILDQIDPLRKKSAFAVESEIISEGLSRQKSRRPSRNKR
ncbi:uncharacterized protein GGS22DRAFT_199708 [Annulohypoxylon maeteangense]|uniref:uncharacterized protein n=1 Tax=Annulohypoxylon maeteangense TaxID=1927788 RepID=UPI0020079490|nr:uncharacterized protein GGS22DRAFT_199708 [Annulohypoxylon maeteangense]KAI0886434.1 hypothetical protein GGS22DRAFT_199708 [Annulohypoxylon maeteangense]